MLEIIAITKEQVRDLDWYLLRHAVDEIGAFVVKQSLYGSNLTIYTIYYEKSV